ncbi:zinc knuckle CX2CX4HX4C containing protein [Tanacetum coccineum]
MGLKYARETIPVEYEWKPSRCHSCRIFGHSIDQCPRNIVFASLTVDNLGFQEVQKKRSNASKTARNGMNKSGGHSLNSMFPYEPRDVENTSKSKNGSGPSTSNVGNKHKTILGNGSGLNTSKDSNASGTNFVTDNGTFMDDLVDNTLKYWSMLMS